jgi:hypothetical protein
MLSGWLTSPAEAAGARQRLWTGELDWVRIPGTCLAERARFLDVFLDALAGANTDASWVLDGRFEALLVDGDVATARDARALWHGMPDREPWRVLRAELARHGAPTARECLRDAGRRALLRSASCDLDASSSVRCPA